MDMILKILATIFDKFKAQNPLVATIIIAVLIAFSYFLQTQGEEVFGEAYANILQWVNWILLGLQGSRTTNILTKNGDSRTV